MRTACLALLLAATLSGCSDPTTAHDGPCAPAAPLLVYSSGSAMPLPEPYAPSWYVAWDDGTVWHLTVRQYSEPGTWNESRVTSGPGLDASRACAVLSHHGGYPDGVRGPPSEDRWRSVVHVETERVAHADAETIDALRAVIDADLPDLPANASLPDCADGGFVAITGMVDGQRHRTAAICQWTDDFEAFRAEVRGLLATALEA